jgi:hypothetical protein
VGRKLALLKPSDPVKPGTHPCALEMSPDGKTLYVALANRDAVAAVDVSGSNPMVGDKAAEHGAPASGDAKFAVKGYFDTRLPGQSYFGAEPDALALSADGSRLYAANMGSDAVAVIDTRKLTAGRRSRGWWSRWVYSDGVDADVDGVAHPTSAPGSVAHEKLYVATDKGRGTGPNNFAQKQAPGVAEGRAVSRTLRRCCMGRWRRSIRRGGPEGGDGGGDGVEPDEGGGGEDCVRGRRRPDQARDLHH